MSATQNSTKPIYLQFTDQWFMKLSLLWCFVSIIVGVTFVEVVVGIAVPLMTLFMLYAGKWMAILLIAMHKSNPFMSRRFFDFAILFFWGAGIYGFLAFILGTLFTDVGTEHGKFFFIAASVFPLGCSVGASAQWHQRENYS